MKKLFLKSLYAKAKKNCNRIVFPDALDERTLFAVKKISKVKIAVPILVGDKIQIQQLAKKHSISLSGIEIVDNKLSPHFISFANTYYNLRKEKGISLSDAKKKMENPLYFAAMMVKKKFADGGVCGSLSTTSDVVRAGIEIIGVEKNSSIMSSFFLVLLKEKIFLFSDCAVNPTPNEVQLSEIVVQSVNSFKKLFQKNPKVAMLSFSTKGSAKHSSLEKIICATELVKKKFPKIIIDGELQLDSAIVPEIAKRKCKNSSIKGDANILIFPDLNSGNIAYKLAERMANATAIGPILQGLSKPFFDLSRGCSVDDIVNVSAINSVM